MRIKIIPLVFILLTLAFNCQANAQSLYEEDWLAFLAANQMVLDEDSDNPEARFQLAVAQANLGFVEEAMESFSRFDNTHNPEQSQKMLNKTQRELEETPDNFLMLNQKGFLLFSLQRNEEAEDIFQELIQKDRENHWLYNFLALTQFAQIKTEEARSTLHKSLDIKDNNYTHALLGQFYWVEGKYIRAWRHFLQTGSLLLSIRQSFRPEVD